MDAGAADRRRRSPGSARAGVAVAPVREPKDAVRDEQVLRRGETARLAHPLHGEVDEIYGPGLPIRFSASETSLGVPPLLGQDSETVYRDVAGYSAEQVAHLRVARRHLSQPSAPPRVLYLHD